MCSSGLGPYVMSQRELAPHWLLWQVRDNSPSQPGYLTISLGFRLPTLYEITQSGTAQHYCCNSSGFLTTETVDVPT